MIDLQGVGTHYNPAAQGAHLVQQIKKAFPEKFVIAYTGGAPSELLVPSVERADKFVQKDIRIEEWCELLDDAAIELADPVHIWDAMRHRLLDLGVTPYQLAHLEDEFVRSAIQQPQRLADRLSQRAERAGISEDIRALVVSLIANSIFLIAT
jgi:hypothetical protein